MIHVLYTVITDDITNHVCKYSKELINSFPRMACAVPGC